MAKTENYSAAQVAIMLERYTACGTGVTDEDFSARNAVVKELEKEFGKKERSIRSKLVSMKDENGKRIYIKAKTASTVTHGEPAKKDAMALSVSNALGDVTMPDGKVMRLGVDSMAKCNKVELGILLHVFNTMIIDDLGDEPETDVDAENSGELTD